MNISISVTVADNRKHLTFISPYMYVYCDFDCDKDMGKGYKNGI